VNCKTKIELVEMDVMVLLGMFILLVMIVNIFRQRPDDDPDGDEITDLIYAEMDRERMAEDDRSKRRVVWTSSSEEDV
jgi:hypothetical protein